MDSLEQVLRALTRVVLAGEWTAGSIVARLQTAVRAQRRPRWFGTLAGRIVRASPALANLAAYRLDCRLNGLARKAGAFYTRYTDDLVFSGGAEFRRSLPQFRVFVCAVAIDEGFSIRARKTRVTPRAGRQRVAGINLNHHLNTDRCVYESLKATLFNCGRTSPAAQNRDDHPHFREHLQGRIAWMRTINPLRAAKLQVLFDHIDWSASAPA